MRWMYFVFDDNYLSTDDACSQLAKRLVLTRNGILKFKDLSAALLWKLFIKQGEGLHLFEFRYLSNPTARTIFSDLVLKNVQFSRF